MRSLILGVLCLFGCSNHTPSKLSSWMEDTGRPKVLSTVAMIDDLVRKIGGDKIDALTLITGETDPHTYELVKGDDEKFECADLVFANGLGLEHGASLIQRILAHPNSVFLGDAIPQNERIYVDDQVDPHIWMDVNLFMQTIDPITLALIKLLPEEKDEFRARANHLKEAMVKADELFKKRIHAIPKDKRYLITTHDAFNYFSKRYMTEEGESWRVRCMAPEGLSPEGQLTLGDIKRVVNFLIERDVHVLFTESNVNADSLRKIAEISIHRGKQVEIADDALLGDSMGSSGSYLEMLEHNVHVLETKLQ